MEGNLVSRSKLNHLYSRINSIALIVLFLPVITLGASNSIQNNAVVNKVKTKVTLDYDQNTIVFDTNALDLGSALSEKNVILKGKDIVEPNSETKLLGGSLEAKIIREFPVLVDDDGSKKIIYSGYGEPKKILEQNNIKTFEEDRISEDLIFDFFNDQSLGKKIFIKRAPVIYISVDGTKKEFRTWAKTVKEALEEKGVLVGSNDKVEPTRERFISNELEVNITRVSESEVKETEILPFETRTVDDSSLEYGKTNVKQAGKNGEKEFTYKIISENGIQVSRTLISVNLVSSPIEKIIVNGTKPKQTFTGSASHMSQGIYGKGGCAFRGYSGQTLKVTNQNNGKSVLVKVVDYGPAAWTGRIIDLSYDDFYELSGTTGIMGNVRVDVLN